jgi:hypothetical protein
VSQETKKVRRVRQVAEKKTRRVRQPTKLPQGKDPIEIPEIPKLFRGIIHTRKEIDPESEWAEIREWLASKPTSIQEMREAVRVSADMAARANDLYDLTKIHHSRFMIECKARLQLWRREALIYWESVKQNEGMHKQITEQMIEDQIIEEHADDYADLQERMKEMDTLKSSFKSLIDSVIAKGVDNRKLLESEIRRPSSTPAWMDGNREK